MSDGQLGEDTYSLIFTSLRHPIRRKILRMLADQPSSFSEILDAVSVDSGHLSYHLENLGELVRKPQDGKYELSSIGVAAVKLMSGVEEHQTHSSGREQRIRLTVMNVFPLILVAALIWAGFFFVGFTVPLRVDLQGFLAVHEPWQFFERPWFYYGVACFLLALPYPIWIAFLIFKKPRV